MAIYLGSNNITGGFTTEEKKQFNNSINLINEQLDNKANELDLQVERNRIDLLTKVENGETEGNTELLDIRNGANGEKYNTAGEMIRDIAKGKGINNKSVHRNKLSFYELNEKGNWIVKDDITVGYYYNTNGEKVIDQNAGSVEFNINSSKIYKFNFDSFISYWNNDAFISGYLQASLGGVNKSTLQNIPDNANKVKMSMWKEAFDYAKFTLEEYYTDNLTNKYIDNELLIPYENIINRPSNNDGYKLYEYGNLLEIDKLIKGLVNQNGIYDPSSNDYTTDFLEIKDYKFDFVSMISFWNNNKEFVSGYIAGSVTPQYPATLSNIPDNAKYVRFTVWAQDLDFAVLALTNTYVNNLKTYYYKEGIISANENINKKLENNPLFGKSFLFTGDSWCAGNTSAPDGWAGWLKKKNPSITIKNCGIHGQDWEQGYNHWIANKENWNSLSDDYDYIIMEAYTNGLYVDVDQLSKPLGSIDEFTYYNSDDEIKNSLGDTYACYLELFLFNMAKRYHGKKKMLMFPYKAVAHNRENNAFRKFRSEVIKCANKYNIKVFDNFNGCNIPTWSQEMIDLYFFHGDDNGEHGDRVHLNDLGYDIICPPIEFNIKML